MNSQKDKNTLFNQCVNEFKSKHWCVSTNENISEIKKRREEILEKAEPYVSHIFKTPETYKEIIRKEFAEITANRISKYSQTIKKEFKVEKKFQDYVENFWKREEMQNPQPYKDQGWGGAGLVISFDKTWTGNEGDIAIHTNDSRFATFTSEVYWLCDEITNYGNKYWFFEIIGETLQRFQREDQALEMTHEIFNELVKGIKGFIETELRHIQEHNGEVEYYSDTQNY